VDGKCGFANLQWDKMFNLAEWNLFGRIPYGAKFSFIAGEYE
jgi:hypothetical protein